MGPENKKNAKGADTMMELPTLSHDFRFLIRGARILAVLWLVTALGTGCSVVDRMMYSTTGDVMEGFSRDHTMPYLLATDDLAMGCAMSEATAPLLMSFGRVTDQPDQLAVMLYLSAGSCAEDQAREHELAALAALKAVRVDDAEDAMIRQKRAYERAASRYYQAWRHHNAFYGEVGSGGCPEFDDDLDEFIYLAGLLSGLQALNAQVQSTSAIGVPANLGAVVARGTACLSNDKWWGAPVALRATVWAMIPGALPQGEDPFQRLAMADAQGEAAGVRLAHVFHAIAALNTGDEARIREVIRRHAESLQTDSASDDWRFVDAMATHMMVAISDRLWMENTGHRTPLGRFGSFWDDAPAAVETMDLEGLL